MTRKLNGCDCCSGVCSLFLSFDGLLEEKGLELVMDLDVGGGGKGETLSLLSSSYLHNIFYGNGAYRRI